MITKMTEEQKAGFQAVAAAVHAGGAAISMQLTHGGGFATAAVIGQQQVKLEPALRRCTISTTPPCASVTCMCMCVLNLSNWALSCTTLYGSGGELSVLATV